MSRAVTTLLGRIYVTASPVPAEKVALQIAITRGGRRRPLNS